MTVLSDQKMKDVKDFLDTIHIFNKVEQTPQCYCIAMVSIEENRLFINAEKWVAHCKIDPLKDEPLSAKEKSILLHELGHVVNKHVLPDKPLQEWDAEHSKLIHELKVKHEVEAQTWAMNYALDHDWQDVYNEFVLYILLFMVKSKREANLAMNRMVIYYKMADIVIEDMKKCTHINFNRDILSLLNIADDTKNTEKELVREIEMC